MICRTLYESSGRNNWYLCILICFQRFDFFKILFKTSLGYVRTVSWCLNKIVIHIYNQKSFSTAVNSKFSSCASLSAFLLSLMSCLTWFIMSHKMMTLPLINRRKILLRIWLLSKSMLRKVMEIMQMSPVYKCKCRNLRLDTMQTLHTHLS